MSISTVYNVFVRDFRKQRKRIILTLVALAWGTMSIMLLLAFGEGLHRQLTINKRGMGTNIGVLWPGTTTKPFKGMGKGRRLHLYQEDPEYLAKVIPELKLIGGEYIRWGVRAERGNIVLSERVHGIPPCWEEARAHYPQMGGRMINNLDMENRRRVAFIGPDVASRLFGDADPIGKTITLNSIPFTVIGVMIEKIQMGNYSGMDEDAIDIPATTFKAIFGDPYLDNIVYKPEDPAQMPLIEQKIYQYLGAKYGFDPTDDRALSIWDTVANGKVMDNILFGTKIFLGVIGFLTLLIAGVGVANIMYVSIKERTREIGIKMAVGARKSLILTQFLIEALLITFLGGAVGMSISAFFVWAFKFTYESLQIQSDVMDFMGLPTLSMEIGLVVVTILGLMGVISGFFPALRASSVNPVESLRYE